MAVSVSKRSQVYKRRMDAFSCKPDEVVRLIERALAAGFTADYVLMDSWFTQLRSSGTYRSWSFHHRNGQRNETAVCPERKKTIFTRDLSKFSKG